MSIKTDLEDGKIHLNEAKKLLDRASTSLSDQEALNHYADARSQAWSALNHFGAYLQCQEDCSKEMLEGRRLLLEADDLGYQAREHISDLKKRGNV